MWVLPTTLKVEFKVLSVACEALGYQVPATTPSPAPALSLGSFQRSLLSTSGPLYMLFPLPRMGYAHLIFQTSAQMPPETGPSLSSDGQVSLLLSELDFNSIHPQLYTNISFVPSLYPQCHRAGGQ